MIPSDFVLVKNIVKFVGAVCNRTSSGESAVANRTYSVRAQYLTRMR